MTFPCSLSGSIKLLCALNTTSFTDKRKGDIYFREDKQSKKKKKEHICGTPTAPVGPKCPGVASWCVSGLKPAGMSGLHANNPINVQSLRAVWLFRYLLFQAATIHTKKT